MKCGAGDDPFTDESADNEDEQAPEPISSDQPTSTATEPSTDDSNDKSQSVTSATALPYKYRRSSVKEGRTQQPMCLQDSTEQLIEATVDEIEAQFDEDVYKADVVEAMIVAGGEETTTAAILQRWGYSMKNR